MCVGGVPKGDLVAAWLPPGTHGCSSVEGSPYRPLPSLPWGSPSLLSRSAEAGREKGMIIIKKEGRDSPMKEQKITET